MNTSSFYTKQMTLQKEMKYHGTKVLGYEIRYPQFYDETFRFCLDLINRYYEKHAVKYQQHDIAPYSSGKREFLIPLPSCGETHYNSYWLNNNN